MPVLSSANRTRFAYKLEGVYPTNFGTLITAGNGTQVSLTGESLTYDVKTEASKNLRDDRGITSHTQVGATQSGDVNVEHVYRDFDPFYAAVMGSTFVEYGTGGLSTAMALTLTSTTVGGTSSGLDAWSTKLARGDWFSVIPAPGATQVVKNYFRSRAFRVHGTTAPTDALITLDPATPINTALAGASLTGARVTSSRLVTGGDLTSFNLEVGHIDISVFRKYKGMIPGKLNWKLQPGSMLTGSITFMGRDMELGTTTSMGTPLVAQPFASSNATRGVFDVFEAGVSLSTNTYIKSADITFDGSLRVQDAVGVFGAAGIATGTFKIGGTLEVYFTDKVMYEKFLNGQNSSLALPILDIDGNGYVYVFPNIAYTATKVNATGQDTDNMLSMTFECDIDNTLTSPTYQKMAAIYRVGAARV